MSLFSLIVPTRARTAGFRCLLDSLCDTARDPTSIEVVAVIDEDDAASRSLAVSGLRLERVIVPGGLPMGELNLAGYRAASGRYLMLLNDDVVARTKDWDTQLLDVLRSYSDGIVLAHTNDLIFRDTFCTFPVLTRDFCELAGGICPPDYRRYCIDDHIHHTFDLLHLLGHTRRVYLPEVIFEHRQGAPTEAGRLTYTPEPAVHKLDAALFEERIDQRRELALACLDRIEGSVASEERRSRERLLEEHADSRPGRRREYARWRYAGDVSPHVAARPRPRGLSRVAAWICQKRAELAARRSMFRGLGGAIPATLFDEDWYRSTYRPSSDANPLLDYLRRGGFEGCDPNPHFDSTWYLQVNPDVAASGLNPLVHFVRDGAREGRSPSLLFDIRHYESQTPEASATGVNPLEHFIANGIHQGRSPLAHIDLAEYWRRLRLGNAPGRREAALRSGLTVD